MGLCVGYESALRYWLTKQGDEELPERAPAGALVHAEATAALVKRGTLPFTPERGRPLHLVVGNQGLKHCFKGAQVHVCRSAMPSDSFCRLPEGNLVSSPELTFLQMATTSSPLELVEIGNYLCSGFSIGDAGRGYVGERQQLTSVDGIRGFLDSLPRHAYGVRRAREALEHVVERTASPKESELAMHYRLPPGLGGRGPWNLTANQKILIDEHGQRILGKDHLVGDLYLPDYDCDLEFDSMQFHTGRFRLDHTQARRNVLEAMGIKTVSATEGQINTIERLDDFTWLLEERAGMPHPAHTSEEREAQEEMFSWLADPQRALF